MTIDQAPQTGVVAAAGTATITYMFGRNTATVTQVSVDAPNVGGGASAGVYLNDSLITPLVPQGDAATGDPPVIIRPGNSLKIKYFGAAPGALIQTLVFYDDGH